MPDGDLTRSTFDAARHFSSVRLQQGRVALDADWNEQVDLAWHRDVRHGSDTVGPAGRPRAGGGFQLSVSADGADLLLSPGRCWVAGVLCESGEEATAATLTGGTATVVAVHLDDRPLAPHDWVRLTGADGTTADARLTSVDLAERAIALDPAPPALAAPVTLSRLLSYAVQPDLPAPDGTAQADATVPRTVALDDGQYLAYLDVWQRSVTALEDPRVREPALGGPDTATRTRTVWQLRLLPLTGAPAGLDDESDLSPWTGPAFASPTGRLAARAELPDDAAGICTPTAPGGYVGLENQLYRVQVYDVAGDGTPSLLWSRENGSVVTAWTGSTNAGELRVTSIGPDSVRGFAGDQWVELTDEEHLLHGRAGTLVQLLKAEGSTLFADPSTATAPGQPPGTASLDRDDYGRGAVARRWDGDGLLTAAPGDWADLEDGVQVRLTGGTYRRGDHWLIPARTSTAGVQWPVDALGRPLDRAPDGVHHDAALVALVASSGGTLSALPLLREFPSLTALTAADVSYDDEASGLPGAETVQQALDVLAARRDLRRHHQRLHGWGIVDGLQVRCGPNRDAERRNVTVRPGSAITPLGDDLDLAREARLDVLAGLAGVEQDGQGPVLDPDGNGEVCLSLSMTRRDRQGNPELDLSRYTEPTRRDALEGTLLMDFYRDHVQGLTDWLDEQFRPPPGEEDLPVGPQRQLVAALGNLAAQSVNPGSGRQIFVSRREDALLQDFYTGLRERLQSQTFCAMFAAAREPAAYPDLPEGLDTVFGTGGHDRIRLRPGGGEAWTVGSGRSPLKPAALVNRYDLSRRVLLQRIDPVAGITHTADNDVDTGTAAVTDVAFSPDGRTVYVAIPTRNEDNTIFRAGTVTREGVTWRPAVTICGLKLVTLATTDADPNFVYAVAHHKQTVTENGKRTTTWHGTGVLRIDPANVEAFPQPLPVPDFFPAGHLAITPEGLAVATAMAGDVEVGDYAMLVQLSLPGGQESGARVVLPEPGSDDLAAVSFSDGVFRLRTTFAAVVVGDRDKQVAVYNLRNGGLVGRPVLVHEGRGAVGLAGAGTRFVATVADEYLARVVDATTGQVVDQVIPLQVGPMSVAAVPRSKVLVALNYVSDTISVIPVSSLEPPPMALEPLRDYRARMLQAFADLLGGFLQYLKEGFFDHFLVNAPRPTGEEVLYLAAVSIRDRQVYRVCNFSRRRYVKSFPLLGYWLSAVPVLQLLGQEFARLACTVLVDRFGRFSADPDSEAGNRVDVATLTQLLAFAQSRDLGSRVSDLRGRRSMIRNAVRSTVRTRPRPSPAGGPLVGSSTVGQPTEVVTAHLAGQGVTVVREPVRGGGGVLALPGQLRQMLGDAQPGDTVTLYESGGTVQYFRIARGTAAPAVPATPAALEAPGGTDLLARLAALEAEVAQLRSAPRSRAATARSRAADRSGRPRRQPQTDPTESDRDPAQP